MRVHVCVSYTSCPSDWLRELMVNQSIGRTGKNRKKNHEKLYHSITLTLPAHFYFSCLVKTGPYKPSDRDDIQIFPAAGVVDIRILKPSVNSRI